MKKLLRGCMAVALAVAMMVTSAAATYANDAISVSINGQAVVFSDQSPVIVDCRTLVPVAGVFQALGFDVEWNGETRQVTLTRGNDVVVIIIDSSTFTTNGVNHNLDVPAQLIGSRTMLPIAAVLRSVGYEVDWDDSARTVLVSGGTAVAFTPIPTPPVQPVTQPPIQQTPPIAQPTGTHPAYITIGGETFNTNETNLILRGKNLSCADIVPLRYMTSLTNLALNNNQISDITPLYGLTNLISLRLSNNQISDITPLAGLTNLTYFDLDFNQVSDLTPLAGLTSLQFFSYAGNPITDLSPVSHVERVTYYSLDW